MKCSIIILSFLICLCGFTRSEAGQGINLKSVNNARELGGYTTNDGRKVKHGVLLRTADLNKISSEDVKHLTEDYSLSVIADLRMTYEIAPKPDPVIDDVKYTNLRYFLQFQLRFLLAGTFCTQLILAQKMRVFSIT